LDPLIILILAVKLTLVDLNKPLILRAASWLSQTNLALLLMGLLAPGHSDARACESFLVSFRTPTRGPRRPEHHQHREEGDGAADVQTAPGGGDTEARR
jgi:hypothetical protein